ncbi:sigma-70 family RNA polymerase sigma factor [Marinilongibacter aquaticus]|uniref:RNA polymerase sigma factor n=1 Tax=Marinilongibacter aquaticus TaxID=2975157 RepID=UPI0021BDADA2|nr:sigma-70 family RNA polymerase sigma factor [Marinilongibacter aquaticus]UBM58170.1 sigma-70 family RNA polymerase sigma factor [Marinilongibacter aquaticus]
MPNPIAETNFRVLYGKLFAALTRQYGVHRFSEIEDAIQNSFLKAVKKWKPDSSPKRKEDWLFITAKNDLLNQLKKNNKVTDLESEQTADFSETETSDLRLETVCMVTSSSTLTKQAKIVFVLKNIFGLSVPEIAENTLLREEAIYKIVRRAKNSLQTEYKSRLVSDTLKSMSSEALRTVEEVLYAVFNTGFDSFSEKNKSIVNEDLCLESFALAKILLKDYSQESTSNLLSLFCFHIARLEAKVDADNLISFFKQDQNKWNKEMINLGFHYLKKPNKIDKFYIEALIVSKYMSAPSFDLDFWKDIIRLYEILLQISPSPIVEINYCFCLFKAERKEEAMGLLEKLEGQLATEHTYLSLLKASLLSESKPKESQEITAQMITKMNQEIRKRYLLENKFINL